MPAVWASVPTVTLPGQERNLWSTNASLYVVIEYTAAPSRPRRKDLMPRSTQHSEPKSQETSTPKPVRMEDKDTEVRNDRLPTTGSPRRPWSERDKTQRGW